MKTPSNDAINDDSVQSPSHAWRRALLSPTLLLDVVVIGLMAGLPNFVLPQHVRPVPVQNVNGTWVHVFVYDAPLASDTYTYTLNDSALLVFTLLGPLAVAIILSVVSPARGAVKAWLHSFLWMFGTTEMIVSCLKAYCGYMRRPRHMHVYRHFNDRIRAWIPLVSQRPRIELGEYYGAYEPTPDGRAARRARPSQGAAWSLWPRARVGRPPHPSVPRAHLAGRVDRRLAGAQQLTPPSGCRGRRAHRREHGSVVLHALLPGLVRAGFASAPAAVRKRAVHVMPLVFGLEEAVLTLRFVNYAVIRGNVDLSH